MSQQTNHVTPGGDPLQLRLSDTVTLTKFSVGEMDNNVYLFDDAAGTLLVDAAADPDRIRAVLGDRNVATIVTTHRHPDHVQALAEVARDTGARLVCGTPDEAAIAEQTGVQCETVWTGDTVPLPGGEELAVIGLVGHTPGSITLAYTPPEGGTAHLITGDSLFPGGVGNTFGDADAFASLVEDVRTKVFERLPDETWVYPGHGDDSVLGNERPHLEEWRERGW